MRRSAALCRALPSHQGHQRRSSMQAGCATLQSPKSKAEDMGLGFQGSGRTSTRIASAVCRRLCCFAQSTASKRWNVFTRFFP